MSASSLDPDNLPATPDRVLGSGHGKGALGPSDNSDSGSDMQGIPGQDPESLDSDSDAAGTGERSGVEPPELAAADGGDIDTDHIETMAQQRRAESGDVERDDDAAAPQRP